MEENAAVNAVNEAAAGTFQVRTDLALEQRESSMGEGGDAVSYTHLRAHET